ncbi:exonuclease SbcC [Actinoplanes oblitus]|uniref:Exonuclease SbcC n=1 Tax=Actinoplanes oblitus TaxID=3040509 RepID=A0ABY8W7P4_9ACTN|nr:exonuclease SbcC [Actinoplanes oblitus]WIM93151.1 exonuclease SbcC [Actinoplanes oblitus]
MTDDAAIALSLSELREVTGFAVACARPALEIYEREHPDDPRPRAAIEAARGFADGAKRTKLLRDCAFAAHRAAQESRDLGRAAAHDAARAAGHTCGAAFLHPLSKATQVIHILGAAGSTARACELSTGDPAAALAHLTRSAELASPAVIDVLKRYPPAPAGGGRVGELIRHLDATLR